MNATKRFLGKKAAKATARHSVHGMTAKVQRKPFRSTGLLSAGMLAGLVVGWLTGHKTARQPAS